MNINKLKVFANDVDAPKSTAGLELERGFPKGIKPARGWFNYLFNSITLKTNEIIEGLNELMAKEHFDVGDLYLTTASHTPESVAEKMGYGEWQRYAEGKALIGLSTSPYDPEWTRNLGTAYGDYEHTLSLDETPEHSHRLKHGRDNGSVDNDAGTVASDTGSWSGQWIAEDNVEVRGGGLPHNNVQPSIVIEIWKRVS